MEISVTYVDGTDLKDFEKCNPSGNRSDHSGKPVYPYFFTVVDLEGVAKLAHAHGIKTYIDNTYSTPVFQKPS